MGEIRIENLDVTYKAEEGSSILDLNLENNIDHTSFPKRVNPKFFKSCIYKMLPNYNTKIILKKLRNY